MRSWVRWAVLTSALRAAPRPTAALLVRFVGPGVRLRHTSATSTGPPSQVFGTVSGHRVATSVRPGRRLRDKAVGASALAALGATFAALTNLIIHATGRMQCADPDLRCRVAGLLGACLACLTDDWQPHGVYDEDVEAMLAASGALIDGTTNKVRTVQAAAAESAGCFSLVRIMARCREGIMVGVFVFFGGIRW